MQTKLKIMKLKPGSSDQDTDPAYSTASAACMWNLQHKMYVTISISELTRMSRSL